jgi:N-acetylglucosamine-6-phosphate deacetylase
MGDPAGRALAVINARIFDGKKFIRGNCVLTGGGRIKSVELLKHGKKPSGKPEILDARGKTLCPGFIDMHTHGAAGIYSMNIRTRSDIRELSKVYPQYGVTSVLLAVFYTGKEGHLESILDSCAGKFDGAVVLGTYYEGPFINIKKRGMIGRHYIKGRRAGAFSLLRKIISAAPNMKAMTIAPELDLGFLLSRELKSRGITAAIGHTDALYSRCMEAAAQGELHYTHLFNTMRPMHHREPGPFLAAVDSGATAELICDGVHVHPAAVRLAVKLMGAGRLAVITDSTPLLGYNGKSMDFGGGKMSERRGAAYLEDNTLAGSATPINKMMKNILDWGAASFGDVLTMATSTPASILGLKDRGRLKKGYIADMAIIDGGFRVYRTINAGKTTFVGR